MSYSRAAPVREVTARELPRVIIDMDVFYSPGLSATVKSRVVEKEMERETRRGHCGETRFRSREEKKGDQL